MIKEKQTGYAYCFNCKKSGKGNLEQGHYGEFYVKCKKCDGEAPVFVWATPPYKNTDKMNKFRQWEKNIIRDLND